MMKLKKGSAKMDLTGKFDASCCDLGIEILFGLSLWKFTSLNVGRRKITIEHPFPFFFFSSLFFFFGAFLVSFLGYIKHKHYHQAWRLFLDKLVAGFSNKYVEKCLRCLTT